MLFWASTSYAQNIPTILKADNEFIQQRLESFDLEGWLYFKPSALLLEKDLFVNYKASVGLSAHDSMYILESTQDQEGYTHNHYLQYYKGIKVEGSDFMEHTKSEYVELVHGKIIENLAINNMPTFTKQQALKKAMEFLGANKYAWEDANWEQRIRTTTGDSTASYYPQGELVFSYAFGVPNTTENYKLAWRFEITAISPFLYKTVYVNAHTNSILKSFDMVWSDGPAHTLYDGMQVIDTEWYGGIFHAHHHLETGDLGRNIRTRRGTSAQNSGNLGVGDDWDELSHLYDDDGTWDESRIESTTAHFSVTKAWDYFKSNFSRKGMNDANAEIRIYAGSETTGLAGTGGSFFWKGGDNKNYIEFGLRNNPQLGFRNTASLDIAGHEFTHGLILNEANFEGARESGALAESFCDIFGAMTEQFHRGGVVNWLHGQDVNANRDFINPNSFNHPATYLGTYWYDTQGICNPTAGNDYCGVHTNCSVQNRWYFLLSQQIGAEKAAKIAYRNLCNFLVPTSNYAAARLGSIAAARQLFGHCSDEVIKTTNTWAQVGVGPLFSGPCVGITGPPVLCAETTEDYEFIYNAIGIPGASFTWQIPVGWIATPSGINNSKLIVNYIPGYFSYPAYANINVFSSAGGNATLTIKMFGNCEPKDPKINDNNVDNRSNNGEKFADSPFLAIYPNPTTGDITIYYSGSEQPLSLKIVNSVGKVVLEKNADLFLGATIETSRLPIGVYYVYMKTANGEVIVKGFSKI